MVRLRHRYLIVELEFQTIKGKKSLSQLSLMNSIQKSIRDLHGIHGMAVSRAGLHASYLNSETSIGFIRMRRSAYNIVSSSLPLVHSIESHPCSLTTLYTGATIKHCNMFLTKYQKRQLEAKYAALTTDVQREEFKLELNRKNLKIPLIPVFKR